MVAMESIIQLQSLLKNFPVYRQQGWEQAGFPYLFLTLTFTALVFITEAYLDLRQLSRFGSNAKLPSELKSFVSDDTFKSSIAYRKDTFRFKIFESWFGFVYGLSLVILGYMPFMWDIAKHTSVVTLGISSSNGYSDFFEEVMITSVFIACLTLIDTFVNLLFSLYSTFVVEQKHGFNKSTLVLFLQDKVMMLGLTFVLSLPVLSVMIWLVRIGGPHFYFYVWVFLCIVSILLMTIYPTLIAPLFNKYTKLEDGEVKTAIENLAKKVDFPLTNIFSVDGSRRSAHSNAYFYGFFKSKRIVLYDTLLKQVELGELLAILGHEIGHWKLWHTIQGFVITQLYTFCLFLVFSMVQHTPDLFSAFGFTYTEPMPVIIGLVLFSQTFWSPVDKFLSLAMTFNSRTNEFAADAFAASLGMGKELASGLIKISIGMIELTL